MISKKIYKDTIEDVKWVQTRLTEHGFKCSVDGNWGNGTQDKLKAFQKARGLSVDGVVGKTTRAALKAPKKIKVTNFKTQEFRCQCAGKYCSGLPSKSVDPKLLELLEVIRAEVNRLYGKDRVVIINSGYRCPTWNRLRGGAKASQHMSNPANAADIRVPGVSVAKVGAICDRLNPNGGVGLRGNNITHVDTRGKRSRWYYN